MKTIKIIMMLALMTIVTSASAMSYGQAKKEARYLADKMAYELNLSDEQYQAAYELNLDYLMSDEANYERYWNRRNHGLRAVLAAWQFNRYVALDYLYRPYPRRFAYPPHRHHHAPVYAPGPRPHHPHGPAPRPYGPRPRPHHGHGHR